MVPDTHPTWMELDRSALIHNVGEIRRYIGDGVKIIASVKANAYGHGIEPVGRMLSQARVEMLATGSFDEAVALRDAGIETPILLLAGALPTLLVSWIWIDVYLYIIYCALLALSALFL